MQGLCTPKADVFSLGIVMWELATQASLLSAPLLMYAASMRERAIMRDHAHL